MTTPLPSLGALRARLIYGAILALSDQHDDRSSGDVLALDDATARAPHSSSAPVAA